MDLDIYEGNQFLFVFPKKGKAEEVVLHPEGEFSAAGREKKIVKPDRPAVFSRLQTRIAVGRHEFQALPLSDLHLRALVTDRKVYKPGDTVNVFCFWPQCADRSAVLEVFWNGNRIDTQTAAFDSHGSRHCSFDDLEEGEYEIKVRHDEEEAGCKFTVAPYTLSFLQSTLVSRLIDEDELEFEISVKAGNMPYQGKLTIGLYCGYCEYEVEEGAFQCNHGMCKGEFSLSGHSGPFTLNISTASGDTASVYIPGTEAETRDKITLSEMGEIVEGGVVPFSGATQKVRGLHLGVTGANTSPVVIDNVVDKKTNLIATTDLDVLVYGVYEPASGEYVQNEIKNVKEGQKIELEIPHPMGVLMTGALGKNCHESYSILIRPDEIDLDVNVPEKAKPGQEVEIKITSGRSGRLLIVAADSRLQRDDPADKFASVFMKNLKDNFGQMHSGKAEKFEPRLVRGAGIIESLFPPMSSGFGANRFASVAMADMGFDMSMGGVEMMSLAEEAPVMDSEPRMKSISMPSFAGIEEDVEEEIEGDELSPPTRMEFPHVILSEIVDFGGYYRRMIRLGEQIGTFRVYAFLMDGLDYISASADVEAAKDVFVELDAPSLVSKGDEIVCRALVKTPDKGKVEVRTSLDIINEEIEGSGYVEFPLRAGGEVMAQVESPSGKDAVSVTVLPPGKRKITTSEIHWLEPGETVQGERVIVYPGAGYLIRDAVKDLIQYPFGCAEQTSAKMYGLALVFKMMKKSIVLNGGGKVRRLLKQGAERMNLFYDNGGFSLWERGAPSDHVTVQVLKNLRPLLELHESEFESVRGMIRDAAGRLLKKGVKDSILMPYDSGFRQEIKTISDAAAHYTAGFENEKAAAWVKERVKTENGDVFWDDDSCWGRRLEATCYGLQVILGEDPEMFKKGFRFVTGRIQNGMLHSTADTCAFLELLGLLEKTGKARAEINGRTVLVIEPRTGESVKAVDHVLVRIDSKKELDFLSPRSDFDGEIKVDRSSLNLGEKITLKVIPLEETQAPLARIFLPGNLLSLKGGAGVQELYLPIKEDRLHLELYGARKGKGKIRVALNDMYDPEKVSVLPGATIVVN